MRLSEMPAQRLDKELADEAGLARSRYAGDRRQHTQRKRRVDIPQIIPRDAAQLEPPVRPPPLRFGLYRRSEQVSCSARFLDRFQPVNRAAVEDFAAMLARVRPDIDDPVGTAHDVQLVLDDEERVSRRLQPVERAQQRLGVRGVKAGRRLVENIDHAEQIGAHLCRQTQALELARRQGRRAPLQREIAKTKVEQHAKPRGEVLRDPLHDDGLFRVAALFAACTGAIGSHQPCQLLQGNARHVGDIHAGELDGERLGLQPLAVAGRAFGAQHELRDALLHHRAGRIGERLHDVASSAGERALVARLFLPPQRSSDFPGVVACIDRHRGLLIREQDPVSRLPGKLAPGRVDVVAERRQDIPQVLAMPRRRPGRDGALADGEGIVRHHRAFGHVIDAAETVTFRAGAFCGIGREGLCIKQRLRFRIVAGARIEHPEQVRERRDAADAGSRGR